MDLSRVVASSQSSDLLQRQRGSPCWNGHAGHMGAGIWEAKDRFQYHFLPKAISRKTEDTQCVNKDLHCIIYAKK